MPAAGPSAGRVLEPGEAWESQSEGDPAPRSLCPSVRVGGVPGQGPGQFQLCQGLGSGHRHQIPVVMNWEVSVRRA